MNGQIGWQIENGRFGNDLLVISSYCSIDRLHRLSVWRLQKPTKLTFFKEWIFDRTIRILSPSVHGYIGCYYVGMHVRSTRLPLPYATFYFISTKTLEIERSLSVKLIDGAAHVGDFFVFNKSLEHVR